jgi:aspartate/methionine/tyrosine aminotransferase
MTYPSNHSYGFGHGLPALKEVLVTKLRAHNALRIRDPERIMITAGSNRGFYYTVLAILDPGNEFILPTPYYFNHEMAVITAGCRAVRVATDADYHLQPQLIEAAITQRTRAIVTISPNNPAGAVYSQAALQAVNDGGSATRCSLKPCSKRSKIQDTILICLSTPSQYPAVGALEADPQYCQRNIRMIGEVRQAILRQLAELGGPVEPPRSEGAVYVLLRAHTDNSDTTLVERLLREHQVADISGSTFGIEEGCYLRIAYGALQQQTVAEGIGRLVKGLKALVTKS